MPEQTHDTLLTIADIQQRLNCGRTTAYDLVASGRIGSIRVSPRTVRVPESELDAFIERNSSQASA